MIKDYRFTCDRSKIKVNRKVQPSKGESIVTGAPILVGGEIEVSDAHRYKIRVRPFIATVPSSIGEITAELNRSMVLTLSDMKEDFPGIVHGVSQDIKTQSVFEVAAGQYRSVLVQENGVAELSDDVAIAGVVLEYNPLDGGKAFLDSGIDYYILIGSELVKPKLYFYSINNCDHVSRSITFNVDPDWSIGYEFIISGTVGNDGKYTIIGRSGGTYFVSESIKDQGNSGDATLILWNGVSDGKPHGLVTIERAQRGTVAAAYSAGELISFQVDIDPKTRKCLLGNRVILEGMDSPLMDGGPHPVVAINSALAYNYDHTQAAGLGSINPCSMDRIRKILSIDSATKKITLTSAPPVTWGPGSLVIMINSDSIGNDGIYTISAISGSEVTVEEDVLDAGEKGILREYTNRANILNSVGQEMWIAITADVSETGLTLHARYAEPGDIGSAVRYDMSELPVTEILLGDIKLTNFMAPSFENIDYSRREGQTFVKASIQEIAEPTMRSAGTPTIDNQIGNINSGATLDARHFRENGSKFVIMKKHVHVEPSPATPPLQTQKIISNTPYVVLEANAIGGWFDLDPDPAWAIGTEFLVQFTAANNGLKVVTGRAGNRYFIGTPVIDQLARDGEARAVESIQGSSMEGEFAYVDYDPGCGAGQTVKFLAIDGSQCPAADVGGATPCSNTEWKVMMVNAHCSSICESMCQAACQTACQNVCQTACECGHEYMPSNGEPTYRNYTRNCIECENACDVADDPLHYTPPTGNTCFFCDALVDVFDDSYIEPLCPAGPDVPGTSTCKISCEGIPVCKTSYQTQCRVGCQIQCECSSELRLISCLPSEMTGVCAVSCQICENGVGAHEVPCGAVQAPYAAGCGSVESTLHPAHTACNKVCENYQVCPTDFCPAGEIFQTCVGPSGQTDCVCSLNCENTCQLSAQTCCQVGCNVACKTACDAGCQTQCELFGDLPACVALTNFRITGGDRIPRYVVEWFGIADSTPSGATTPFTYYWETNGIISGSRTNPNVRIHWDSYTNSPWVKCTVSNACSSVIRTRYLTEAGYCVGTGGLGINGPVNPCYPPSGTYYYRYYLSWSNADYTYQETAWSVNIVSGGSTLVASGIGNIPSYVDIPVSSGSSFRIDFIATVCGGATASASMTVTPLEGSTFVTIDYSPPDTFRADPSGNPNHVWYQWYVNDVLQFGATGRYFYHGVPVGEDEWIKVIITNKCNGETREASIYVVGPTDPGCARPILETP